MSKKVLKSMVVTIISTIMFATACLAQPINYDTLEIDYTVIELVLRVEKALTDAGYDCGEAGEKIIDAITEYKEKNDLGAKESIDKKFLLHLGVELIEEAMEETESAPADTKEATMGEKNALGSAKNYLSIMNFSYKGLMEQLAFEGYSESEAAYAADNCGADWNEQAAGSAQSYIDIMSFSRQGLIDQLKYDGYTAEQAEYGVSAVGY